MNNEFQHTDEKVRLFRSKTSPALPEIDALTGLMEDLLQDINRILELTDMRIGELKCGGVSKPFSDMAALPPVNTSSAYSELLRQFTVSPAERLLLVCSIITHIAPEKLTQKLRDDGNHLKLKYPEFGGCIDMLFTHFVPNLQTVLFLLAGNDKTNAVFYKMALLNGPLVRDGIIRFCPLKPGNGDEQELMYAPVLAQEYLLFLQSGIRPRPDYGKAFPATWVTTGLEWDHLVLDTKTMRDIREVMRWVEHGNTLTESSAMFNVSYPCLFYGPPGTGKSLTAKLIGKKYGKDVFRVDLSMIVSKYVGETEKNLAHLFDRAEGKDWILFFDEADSLFSKRTSVNSAQDKWANLEVSYLLQRMEEHRGLTILATNFKDNLDAAMTRRFQSIIYFPAPEQKERMRLWKTLLPHPFNYASTVSIDKLSAFELSGANIANIVKDACLSALDNGVYELTGEWLTASIRKEFIKEKRTP